MKEEDFDKVMDDIEAMVADVGGFNVVTRMDWSVLQGICSALLSVDVSHYCLNLGV